MGDDLGTSSLLEHPSVARVAEALARSGSTDRLTVLDVTARTADDAAAALGVEVAQIVKSLVFTTPADAGDLGGLAGLGKPAHPGPQPLLVLTSGAHQVNTHQVADLLGIAELGRADADFVREHTGFAIGGVAPIGASTPITTLVDVELARWDVVWAAGGHPRVVFPTTYDELLRLTAGHPAEVA